MSEHEHTVSPADRLEILELLARMNQAFDGMDIARFLSCFEPDGTMEGPQRGATDHRQLEQWVAGTIDRPPHRHFTTNVVIHSVNSTRDKVGVRSCYLYFEIRDGKIAPAGMGLYEDELVKGSGQWRVKRRRAVADGMSHTGPAESGVIG